ncbi:DNA-directed DNA polymerase [Ignicoccus hospitalis]|uniref:DNA polymerase n=1 Tax=Ignicoccus hospitalis (strain KIN4/I / DSM 18386 / JCM 14125) TaxID=453591 RepID=A8A8J4_IGNH4|nr:DNA polymerase II [Ignicoccus hospitalis]ABU81246.1 replicative DNA polymerase I [Ignicoccus hospitalis KIN4/I]HIH90928.1 DNA polymerase II [Desulfurococcaceae archaeon]
MKFYVLDVSYELEGNKPVILIWALDENERRVLLKDKRFRPYFYVLLKENADLERLKRKLSLLSKPKSPIISLEVLKKKLIGREKTVIKVTTVIPESVREYREEVKRLEEVADVLEADIRFSMRYIIDTGLRPCGWAEFEVKELGPEKSYRVETVYEVLNGPEALNIDVKPKLKTLAFDIEVYNKSGTPRPERDPIISIALASEGSVVSKLSQDKNDKDLIVWFKKEMLERDPDVVVGYNSNSFDWPYLIERSKVVGVRLDVGRKVGVIPTTGAYGHVSVPGRLNVDVYDFAKEVYEVKVKTLENVADYFNVMKKDERPLIPHHLIYQYWEDPQKRDVLRKYNEADALSTLMLAELFIPFGEQLSYLTGLPLDQVMAASVGYRVEWYLMRVAFVTNELVPNRVERKVASYKGAIVLRPLKGVHENVAVLDFSSMYPNIMIKYNVGPDTLVRPGEKVSPDEVYVSPAGYMFKKRPDAFFKRSLVTLLNLRKEIKERMKSLSPEDPLYKLLDNRQKAVKVLANAHYGYMGWPHARWYCRECAEAVTSWGRELILKAIQMARELGLKVIYGDTDSLFVIYDKEKVEKLIERIEKELGFEIKIDKIYKKLFFTEAKKRYAGILEDGRIDVVGFEAVRGDWAEVAKEVQEKIIEIVLKEGDVNKAVEYVNSIIEKLRRGEVPIEKLVIWKTLEKSLDEYKSEPPHVAAAKRAIERGYEVKKGDKVGYVIVKGVGKLSSRAWPWFLVQKEMIDYNYYIDHQVIPAAMRILGYFGITEARLKGRKDGLWKFINK